MKIFFAGNYFGNGGPWNVNKNIVACLNNRASYLQSANKLFRLLEVICKIAISKVVIFSGASSIDHVTVPIARFLGKKIIYIMHGCLELEYKSNNNTSNNRGIKNEKILLSSANLVLCVSTLYGAFVAKNYPQYKNKLDVLLNGIDWDRLSHYSKSNNRDECSILLMGGGRKTKRNLQICQAVQSLNEENKGNYKVTVYGYYNENDDSKEISQIPCVTFNHVVPQSEVLKILTETRIFIQNSDFEPFSLGVVEALCCGCDILISKNVGAKEILKGICDNDIIFETNDIEHIKQRILYLTQCSNNQRLLNSIDKKQTSREAAADKLLTFAHQQMP